MGFQKMQVIPDNTVIVKEGEENTVLYKIVSGKAAVYLNYGTDEEYLIGILSDGRYFGEVEFLMEQKSMYSIVALSEMVVMKITKEEFENFVRNNAANAIDIMKAMAREIVMLQKHMDMVIKEVTELISQVESIHDAKNEAKLIDIREKLQQYRAGGFEDYNNFKRLV